MVFILIQADVVHVLKGQQFMNDIHKLVSTTTIQMALVVNVFCGEIDMGVYRVTSSMHLQRNGDGHKQICGNIQLHFDFIRSHRLANSIMCLVQVQNALLKQNLECESVLLV